MKFILILILVLVFSCSNQKETDNKEPLSLQSLPQIEIYEQAKQLVNSPTKLQNFIVENIDMLDSDNWRILITYTLITDLLLQ